MNFQILHFSISIGKDSTNTRRIYQLTKFAVNRIKPVALFGWIAVNLWGIGALSSLCWLLSPKCPKSCPAHGVNRQARVSDRNSGPEHPGDRALWIKAAISPKQSPFPIK
jgi:hypothetical protein